jgi:hypothetical protein
MRAVKDNLATPPERDESSWKGWSLMIFCARATRGRGSPSPGVMVRLGVPVGGRVKKFTQWKIIQPPSLKRERASLEGVSVTALDGRNWSNMDALPGCDNWRTWKNICPTLIAGSSAQLLPL